MKLKGILCIALLTLSLGGCGSNLLTQPETSEPWVMPRQHEDATRLKKMLSQAEETPRAQAQAIAMAK